MRPPRIPLDGRIFDIADEDDCEGIDEENEDENDENDDEEAEFSRMSDSEKKKVIKKRISNQIRFKVKEYLASTNALSLENAYGSFIDWLQKNK